MTTAGKPIGEDDLQALVDGRLTPARRLEVETYLTAQPALAANAAADAAIAQQLRARLAGKAEEPVPPRLRVANIMAERRRARWRHLASAAAAAGFLTIGAAGGWFANTLWSQASPSPSGPALATTRDAITAYRTFVVEKTHPVEVGADQETHLVQWLSRRLGKPLSAPNLAAQGFQLMGGRLLPARNGPAAMFMYSDQAGNRLTLYASTGTGNTITGFRFDQENDVSAFAWADRELAYVVTAKSDRPQLLSIAEAIHHQLAPADGS
ncbi:anti-sigma factor family protein [Labrys neptuniae]